MPETVAEYNARVREIVELQAEDCYMNADRTLASWTRTALSLMAAGTIVDRFGILLLRPHAAHVGTLLAPNPVSTAVGLFLIALGVFIALSAGTRHQAYRRLWEREYGHAGWHGPWLAFIFSLMTGGAGLALIAVLLILEH